MNTLPIRSSVAPPLSGPAALLTAPSVVAATLVFIVAPEPRRFVIVLLPVVIAAVLALRRDRYRRPDVPRRLAQRLMLAVAPACVLATATSVAIHSPGRALWVGLPGSQVVRLNGRVVGDPYSFDGRTRVTIALARVFDRSDRGADARGTIHVVWEGDRYLTAEGSERVHLLAGDTIEVSDLQGLSDGRTMVWTRQSAARIVARDAVGRLRGRLRTETLSRLARLESRANGLVAALLLGDRGTLDPRLAERLRRSGAAHALALSGMHLGVLGVLCTRALRPITIWAGPRAAAVSVGVLLSGYVWLAGWIPSLLRALVFYWLLALRPRDGLVLALARTVCVVALAAPESIVRLGFRLSVLALLGIFVIAPLLRPRTRHCGWLWGYLAVSAGAVAGTMVVSLQTFGVVAVGGVVSAGVLGAVVLVIMWLGLAVLVLAHVPLLGSLAVGLTERCYGVLYALSEFTGRAPVLSGIAAWSFVVAVAILLALRVPSRLHAAGGGESRLAF